MNPVYKAMLDRIEITLRACELLQKRHVLLLRVLVLLDELNRPVPPRRQLVYLFLKLHLKHRLFLQHLLLLGIALGKILLVFSTLSLHFLLKLSALHLQLLLEVRTFNLNALPILHQFCIAVLLEESVQLVCMSHSCVTIRLCLFNGFLNLGVLPLKCVLCRRNAAHRPEKCTDAQCSTNHSNRDKCRRKDWQQCHDNRCGDQYVMLTFHLTSCRSAVMS